jgi:chromosome segregation ATPase
MNSRLLPVINLVGCLALAGLVVVQWRREHVLDMATADLRKELAESRAQTAEEAERRAALERDIVVLKESMEATQLAAETSARNLAAKQQLAGQLEAELAAARQQVTAWEQALKQRDERIGALDAELARTRARLNEAVARLKEAAAR